MADLEIIPLPHPPAGGKREKGIYEAFYISILLKGANAAIETTLGVALLFTAKYSEIIIALIQSEVIDDPNNFFGRHADALLPYLEPQMQLFGAFYLLSHGIVKGILVWGLLKNKLWSYPGALGVFALFTLYPIIKWIEHHSVLLVILTVFNIVVLWLIWHEYHIRLKQLRINSTI